MPVAEEVYPLGGRRGETVGLELRGGTLPGARRRRGDARPGGSDVRLGPGPRDRPGLDARRGRGSTSSRCRRWSSATSPSSASRPTRPRRRSGPRSPVVLNGRIDPAGDEDRFVLAVTPGQKLRIEVEAAELRLGARRRPPGPRRQGRACSPRPTTRPPPDDPEGRTKAAGDRLARPVARLHRPGRA